MKQNETKNAQNVQKKHKIFYCKCCDYSTSHSGMWKRHLDTKKHKKAQMKQNETNETKTHKHAQNAENKKYVIIHDICNESFRTTLCI